MREESCLLDDGAEKKKRDMICVLRFDYTKQKGSAMVKVALWVYLEAKPGKEADVEKFLLGGLPLVEEEPATIAWFALQLGPGKYGIFDVFPDDAGRRAHLTGKVAAALMAKAGELFAKPPSIEKIDVLAAKLLK